MIADIVLGIKNKKQRMQEVSNKNFIHPSFTFAKISFTLLG